MYIFSIFPSGWFGERVDGKINPGERVLVFNAVSQTGRCVGDRLPGVVDSFKAETVAAAVFCKGTANGVTAAEQKYGSKLYAAIQAEIKIEPSESCHLCQTATGNTSTTPTPWTAVRDKQLHTSVGIKD